MARAPPAGSWSPPTSRPPGGAAGATRGSRRRAPALLYSALLRPSPPADAPLLPLAVPLAVCEAAEAVAPVRCQVKWPNDVWIDERKVAGVLVEARPDEGWAVIGVGLNVAIAPGGLPAGAPRDRDLADAQRGRGRSAAGRRPERPVAARRAQRLTRPLARDVGRRGPQLPTGRATRSRASGSPGTAARAWPRKSTSTATWCREGRTESDSRSAPARSTSPWRAESALVGRLGGLQLLVGLGRGAVVAVGDLEVVDLEPLVSLVLALAPRPSPPRPCRSSRRTPHPGMRPCACGAAASRRPWGSCAAARGRPPRACGRRASAPRAEPPRPRACARPPAASRAAARRRSWLRAAWTSRRALRPCARPDELTSRPSRRLVSGQRCTAYSSCSSRV